jgi:uncharacterized protein (DUF1800 family)
LKKILILLVVASVGFGQTTTAPAMSAREAARFLDQSAWGPTPASVAALQQMGINSWLAAQFTATPSDLPDQAILQSDGKSNNDLSPVTGAFFANTVNGADPLRQRVAFILSEIFVVSQVSVHPAYAFPPYWRIFRDNAFGNYPDIVKAVTLSPAMGAYLNAANNNKANSKTDSAANENYARELMQLFTLGLTELNPDGSPTLDANNNPIPTYNQAVVTSLARVFTGWTYPTAPGATAKVNNPAYFFGQMSANESEHDTTAKTVFNHVVIPAGQSAEGDLDSVIAALMQQPTLAPFVGKQLIQHMVTSNPSPAYVQRISQVFSKTNGNLQSVITAILTDPEARAGDDANAVEPAGFGHLREPVLFLSNLVNGLNGTISATNSLNNRANELRQNLFNAPTVFSYFSPLNETESGMLAPEFQIYTTQTASDRADIINTALYGTLDKNITLNLTPFTQQAGNVTSLVNYIGSVFLHSGMSTSLQQQATDAANAQTTALAKAQAALYVVLTSSEYQVIQ